MSLSRRLRRRGLAPLVLTTHATVDVAMVRTAWDSGRAIECPNEDALRDVLATLGGVAVSLAVQHTGRCSVEVCRCKPSYVLRKATVENVVEGMEAERRFQRIALS